MNLFFIIAFNLVLVGLIVTTVMLIRQWRQKRRLHSELEQMLEDLGHLQPLRYNKLLRHLTTKWKLDEDAAKKSADEIQNAEKQFLQGFLQQLLQQHSLAGFHENLYQLLDVQLNALDNRSKAEAAKATHSEEQPVASGEEAVSRPVEDTGEEQSGDEEEKKAEPVPEWGDVFD